MSLRSERWGSLLLLADAAATVFVDSIRRVAIAIAANGGDDDDDDDDDAGSRRDAVRAATDLALGVVAVVSSAEGKGAEEEEKDIGDALENSHNSMKIPREAVLLRRRDECSARARSMKKEKEEEKEEVERRRANRPVVESMKRGERTTLALVFSLFLLCPFFCSQMQELTRESRVREARNKNARRQE